MMDLLVLYTKGEKVTKQSNVESSKQVCILYNDHFV